MIVYTKLFSLLQKHGYTERYWLQQRGIHPATISKLQKNQRVNTDTIDRLCELLECQPGDLMEWMPDKNE